MGEKSPEARDGYIEFDEVRAGLARGDFVLIDVLPAESFAAGHIPGAVSLPLSQIRESATSRFPDRDRRLVVYCKGFT